jgi:choline dehydrogenase-like flavoprotein
MNDVVRTPQAVIRGRTLTRRFEDSCDAIVVGSGAGGSVVAANLAEAGLDVVVVEEGAYYAPEEYADFTPSEALRRLGREAGMLAALGIGETPIIALMAGRCVGGSSVMTGGVCFRIPEHVHDHWDRELGLNELSERSMEAAYADVERRCHIGLVPPHMHSEATLRLTAGARKLGVVFRPLHRNTRGCQGLSLCTFGCPAGSKMSVDVAYLPSALAHGARVVSDAIAERIMIKNGRAAGVEGRLLGGPQGEPGQRFRIRAPLVVAACGTIHTPGLLRASGIGRRHPDLGRHITLHPATRIGAVFENRVDGWNGAMQSVYTEHFQAEGITVIGVYSAVNVLAASMPGFGPSLRRRVEKLPHVGLLGAMVHDEGGGRVRPGFRTREPFFTYEMAGRDLARVRRSLTVLAEIAFSSGAREVYLPIFGLPPVQSVDEARRVETMAMDVRRIECMAFHPLGSARMSNDPRSGVVSQSGECYDAPGVFVADGSVLPTSIGVNSQQAVMTMATRIAWKIRERRLH